MSDLIDLAHFYEGCANDRVIEVFVSADEIDSVLIQQTLFESTSDYFKNALKHESSLGDEKEHGVLRFKEDSRIAWEVLIYWMFRRTLPACVCKPKKEQLLLVNCWILGDKYMIHDFANLIMLELLRVLETANIELPAAEKAIRGSAAGSPMRRLALEELFNAIFKTKVIRHEQLDCLDGVCGLAGSMIEAINRALDSQKRNPSQPFGTTFRRANKPDNIAWKKYMIGNGPGKHWIYGKKEDDKEDGSKISTESTTEA